MKPKVTEAFVNRWGADRWGCRLALSGIFLLPSESLLAPESCLQLDVWILSPFAPNLKPFKLFLFSSFASRRQLLLQWCCANWARTKNIPKSPFSPPSFSSPPPRLRSEESAAFLDRPLSALLTKLIAAIWFQIRLRHAWRTNWFIIPINSAGSNENEPTEAAVGSLNLCSGMWLVKSAPLPAHNNIRKSLLNPQTCVTAKGTNGLPEQGDSWDSARHVAIKSGWFGHY